MGFSAGGFGGGGGIAPASEDQPRLGHFDFVGQRLVAFSSAGLAAQRTDLRVKLAHQVFEPGEVGLGRAELLLSILAADVQPGDSGGFLQHHPAFGRLGGDYGGDLALADQRWGVRAGGGIGKNQRYVFGPHVAAVNAVGTARAAFDPADDLQLAIVVPGIAMEHHFGEVARRARCGTGEDHVFHPAAAHRFGRVFAHHPADCLKQVGLAAAVGADDPGQPRLDAQFSGLNKALESRELEPLDPHRAGPVPCSPA